MLVSLSASVEPDLAVVSLKSVLKLSAKERTRTVVSLEMLSVPFVKVMSYACLNQNVKLAAFVNLLIC